MSKTSVVVLNWNGKDSLNDCLESLETQSYKAQIILVDNGSNDGSAQNAIEKFPNIDLVQNIKNLGFAGGANSGIRRAIENGSEYIALLNNDAVADKDWLKHLVGFLESNPKAGIATSKILTRDGKQLDSTGDLYTIWGLPYPRGRGEGDINKYDSDIWVFGASGGASIYRVKTLEHIGLFDEDLFAYYEDIDISFRAQLAGWKIGYISQAVAYHQISATSSKIKGFAAYQTLKNLPLVLWKNVPWSLMLKIWPRLVLAYLGIAGKVLLRGQFSAFFKGILVGTILWPKKLVQRRKVQKSRKVSNDYINSIVTHDLPPNAGNLRAMRSFWWKLRGKSE